MERAQGRGSQVGRPEKTSAHNSFVADAFARDASVSTAELLRLAREDGYDGGKSAFYAMVARLRPRDRVRESDRDALPGQISEHDFGDAIITFDDGAPRRVHFFASRLRYSGWLEVTIVAGECWESAGRALVDHFASMGGVPMLAVFQRARGVARVSAHVVEWEPGFACFAADLGLGVELRAPKPRRRALADDLGRWARESFFLARRFRDDAHLSSQLAGWLCEEHARVSGAALADERARLRALKIGPADVADRIPAHRERVRLVAGPFASSAPRS